MAGEVAIKKMNFLPVILFQALPIPVSGETIKNIQSHVKRIAADLQLYLHSTIGTSVSLFLALPGRDGTRGPCAIPHLELHCLCVSTIRAIGSRC